MHDNSDLMGQRKSLRKSLRAQRRALSPKDKKIHAERLAHNVDCWLHLRPSWRIALYAALPEELDTTPLIETAYRRGCRIYLPRIDRHTLGRKMQFVEM